MGRLREKEGAPSSDPIDIGIHRDPEVADEVHVHLCVRALAYLYRVSAVNRSAFCWLRAASAVISGDIRLVSAMAQLLAATSRTACAASPGPADHKGRGGPRTVLRVLPRNGVSRQIAIGALPLSAAARAPA